MCLCFVPHGVCLHIPTVKNKYKFLKTVLVVALISCPKDDCILRGDIV